MSVKEMNSHRKLKVPPWLYIGGMGRKRLLSQPSTTFLPPYTILNNVFNNVYVILNKNRRLL